MRMRTRTFAVGLTLVLALFFGDVPKAQAQEPPDVNAGNIVGEMIEAVDFDPTSPAGWATAFSEAFFEIGETDIALSFYFAAQEKGGGLGGVIIAKGSTPSSGVAVVTLDDGTQMTYIWALGTNPPTPKSPSTVIIDYLFPDGKGVTVTIFNQGGGPVITFN